MNKKIINIQSTNKCNASCKCCNYVSIHGKDTKTEMSDDVWNKFINDLKDMDNIVEVHFGVLDEPLMDSKLFDRLKKLQQMNIRTGIVTNCSLLTLDTVKKLYEHGVRVYILSLLSPDKDEFEEFTGLSFNTVAFNILRACSFLANRDGVFVRIAAAREDDDDTRYKKLFGDYSSNLFINRRDNREPSYKSDSIKPYESCFKQLLGRKDIIHGCDVGYTKVYLRYTGDINVCSLDSANKSVVGNIKDESIKSLIDRQESIVLNLKRSVPECCKDCFM